MNHETDFMTGCSEEFAELCALSTSGELSAGEMEILEQHLTGCAPCRALFHEYTNLATVEMAKLAAEHELVSGPVSSDRSPSRRDKRAEERFVTALRAVQPTWSSRLQSRLHLVSTTPRNQSRWMRLVMLLTAVACLLLCVGGGIEIGRKMGANSYQPVPAIAAATQPSGYGREKIRLETELRAVRESLNTLTARSKALEKNLEDLTNTKESLSAQIDSLARKDNADSASLNAITQRCNDLQQQLDTASDSLTQTEEELNQAQQDRQDTQLRLASLETQMGDLHAELATTNRSAGNDEKFLAADRDIRELMGARQLYIADVFDVKNDGTRSKPFGRVFYTQGRSLIFYAFDLEKQPGYRETKTFQAWGKPDGTSAKPISIGVFYMDSEQNRRWVVKSDNPDLLAQINSVFVTVEPHGGSRKPTGKPFLLAYLHTLQPNHP